jgi:hypothetical protein
VKYQYNVPVTRIKYKQQSKRIAVFKWHKVPFLLDALARMLRSDGMCMEALGEASCHPRAAGLVGCVCVCVWMSVVKEAGTHFTRVRERAPNCPHPYLPLAHTACHVVS